jgi:hypothetical protein
MTIEHYGRVPGSNPPHETAAITIEANQFLHLNDCVGSQSRVEVDHGCQLKRIGENVSEKLDCTHPAFSRWSSISEASGLAPTQCQTLI